MIPRIGFLPYSAGGFLGFATSPHWYAGPCGYAASPHWYVGSLGMGFIVPLVDHRVASLAQLRGPEGGAEAAPVRIDGHGDRSERVIALTPGLPIATRMDEVLYRSEESTSSSARARSTAVVIFSASASPSTTTTGSPIASTRPASSVAAVCSLFARSPAHS